MASDAPVIGILNGYPRASRDNFDLSGVAHPHDLYLDLLSHYIPGAQVDVLFVADVDRALPGGAALGDYDGFIWTGSDLTIYHDQDPRVSRQIKLARAIYRVGVPSFGSCWGVQMAAVAAGGQVAKNPRGREWGFARDIRLTNEGRHCAMMSGKPERFDGFTMHLDEVTRLPAGARLLAGNAHTPVQALEVRHEKGVFWATQYHPEYNLREMARLIAARADPLVQEGFFPDTDAVLSHAAAMLELYDDPSSTDLRSRLSVGDDIIDATVRARELRNWIERLVLPAMKR